MKWLGYILLVIGAIIGVTGGVYVALVVALDRWGCR